MLRFSGKNVYYLQRDHSGCSQPPVDTKTKVVFWFMDLILK